MPELPEVETVRRGLAPVMEGRTFARIEQRRADLRFPFPEAFAARLEGRHVLRIDRRAKYLVVHVEGRGSRDGGDVLVMHLGMSGRFSIASAVAMALAESAAPARQQGEFAYAHGTDEKHDHVVFTMSDGAVITYNDARRFGFMDLFPAADLATHKLFRDVGIEPLGPDLTPQFLARAATGRKTDLKTFLMDQRIVCGLGNIYVCEALFRAGLDPRKPASRLATRGGAANDPARRLVPIIRAVLTEAIGAGGSTLRDYAQADGKLGYFQHSFAVYGREGEACVTAGCGAEIQRVVQAGRSTFFCRSCQK